MQSNSPSWREGFSRASMPQARHAGRELVAPGCSPADLERLLVPLAEQHTAAQHLACHGEADAAAARAQVEHTAVRAGIQLVDDRLHQHLGVRARDEHGGRNIQPQTVKFPLADEVGHRLARQMPRAQGIRRTLDLGRGVEQPSRRSSFFVLPDAVQTSSRAACVASSAPASRRRLRRSI